MDRKLVCEVRYVVDPDQLERFKAYATTWTHLIRRHGGVHLGFYMTRREPSGMELSFPALGATESVQEAVAWFMFPSEDAYRQYRLDAARDPECIDANLQFAAPPFVQYRRCFLEPLDELIGS